MFLRWLFKLLIKKEPPKLSDPLIDRLLLAVADLTDDAWFSHAFTTLPTLGENVIDSTKQLRVLRNQLENDVDITPLESRHMTVIDYLTYRGNLANFQISVSCWLEEAQKTLHSLPANPLPHEEVVNNSIRTIIRHHCVCLETIL